eukprot:SAG22_NODE_27_length_29018_cov_465.809646_8_plen_118_part_00
MLAEGWVQAWWEAPPTISTLIFSGPGPAGAVSTDRPCHGSTSPFGYSTHSGDHSQVGKQEQAGRRVAQVCAGQSVRAQGSGVCRVRNDLQCMPTAEAKKKVPSRQGQRAPPAGLSAP